MASIELRRDVTQNEDLDDRQAYVMVVSVENAIDIDEEIFVFQRSLPTVQANAVSEPTDFFISVADPVDLEDYPINAPELEVQMPYFRVSSVTLKFRSMVALDQTWDYIKEDVAGLVKSINTGLTDPITETVVFE